MSSTRPRRSAAQPPAAPPAIDSPRRSRPSRGAAAKPEPEPEVEEEDNAEGDEEEEAEPTAGPSRPPAKGKASGGKQSAARGKAAAAGRGVGRGRKSVAAEEATDDDAEKAEAEEEEEEEQKPYRVRSRKSVSYREVPVEDPADEEEGEDDDATPPPARKSQAPETPSRRRRSTKATSASAAPAADEVEEDGEGEAEGDAEGESKEDKDKPYRFEKIGSGRGGFSVKGAAAAAARARWAKVRRERAERGEDEDTPVRRTGKPVVRRENKAAVEKLKDGEKITIRGVEYIAHNDELPIPDDEKGETKIDAEGRLQGGREYKVFTFSSEGRDNPERLYGLTIDVARACGYTDSLAFLRRYPVIQKLQCQPGEAEMLVDIGRVSGNMKHRMVTIIPMRNVYKLMGARIVKNAKWVTDDYYEDEALAKCAENGFTPYAPAQEEEIQANAAAAMGLITRGGGIGDRERDALTSTAKSNALSPFYTIGGPNTHFAGTGIDPWTEGGWGGRRAKLRGIGVTEDDWMYRTALDCRAFDATLRQYREERIGTLEGDDLCGWVWTNENNLDESETNGGVNRELENPNTGVKPDASPVPAGLRPPLDRKRSALSREVTFEPEPEPEQAATEEALTPIPETSTGDISLETPNGAAPLANGQGEVRVETRQDLVKLKAKWAHGTGSWEAGTIRAAYEPHTHMPHVPLSTQPSSADFVRASPYPILQSLSDVKQRNFVQSTVRGPAARGLASVEYVFDPLVDGQIGWDRTAEEETRKRMVQEAEEWAAQSVAKKRRTVSIAAS